MPQTVGDNSCFFSSDCRPLFGSWTTAHISCARLLVDGRKPSLHLIITPGLDHIKALSSRPDIISCDPVGVFCQCWDAGLLHSILTYPMRCQQQNEMHTLTPPSLLNMVLRLVQAPHALFPLLFVVLPSFGQCTGRLRHRTGALGSRSRVWGEGAVWSMDVAVGGVV